VLEEVVDVQAAAARSQARMVVDARDPQELAAVTSEDFAEHLLRVPPTSNLQPHRTHHVRKPVHSGRESGRTLLVYALGVHDVRLPRAAHRRRRLLVTGPRRKRLSAIVRE
jgi:hypothetical protein